MSNAKEAYGGRARRFPNAMALMIVVSALCACGGGGGDQPRTAGRIFFDNFEDGTTSKWQQDSNRNRCTVVLTSSDGVAGPFAGSRMLRCSDDGTVAWNDPLAFESLQLEVINYSTELFIRARVRADTNLEHTGVSPKKILRVFNWIGVQSTYNDIFESFYPGSNLVNVGSAGGTQFATYWGGTGSDNSSVPTGWHKIEYYINTSGVIRVWHDGVMVQNFTGLSTANAKWFPFTITSNWADSHDGTNYLYFDDFEVFSDTGSGATGSMSDATIAAPGP